MSACIDFHCHVGRGFEYSQEPEALLREMDEWGVDGAVVCPVDRCLAVDNREGNDTVLEAARAHPDRLFAFATANPWYGQRAVEELRRALDLGARGIKLHPALQGYLLCDELVHPLLALAQERRVPVYIHTGTPAYAQPFQLAELARRFPAVALVMGHMGSTDFWMDAVPAALQSDNILLDTSWSLPQKVHRALAAVGEDRVLFSTDSPLSSLRVEMGCRRATELPAAVWDKVMGLNAQRLLGGAR